MKLRMIVAIALVLSAAVAAGAQNRLYRFSTGQVTLGPGQVLRVTVNGLGGNDTIRTQFMRETYGMPTCSGGACRYFFNVEALPVMMLSTHESLSTDISQPTGSGGVGCVVAANTRNIRVIAMIVDTTTGETVSFCSSAEVDTW